jgi:hypothetical protein
MAKIDRPIRITDTVLGTIWIECFEPDRLDLHPWLHESCRLDGQKLPFFGVTLRRVEGRWTVAKFEHDFYHPDAPKWPRGAREKIPGMVLEIGTAWAAEHESLIRDRGTEHLKEKVKAVMESTEDNLRAIRDAIAFAVSLDRLDLLEPIRPLIGAIVGEFSGINRRLAHRKAA